MRHLSFNLQQSGLQYEPGDALAIMPEQPDAAVDAFMQRLGLARDAQVLVALPEVHADDIDRHSFQVSRAGLVTCIIAVD